MTGAHRIALLVLVLAAWAGTVRADGGVVVASGHAGALRASILVSPTPLRSGPAEWSVLLQDKSGAPVLDAEVELELQRQGAPGQHSGEHGGQHSGKHGSHRVVALQRADSANRLLYSARVDLPEPGTWRVALRVTGGEGGRLDFEVPVGPAQSAAAEHWRALALPPLALGLFALHQWLHLRGRRRLPRSAA